MARTECQTTGPSARRERYLTIARALLEERKARGDLPMDVEAAWAEVLEDLWGGLEPDEQTYVEAQIDVLKVEIRS